MRRLAAGHPRDQAVEPAVGKDRLHAPAGPLHRDRRRNASSAGRGHRVCDCFATSSGGTPAAPSSPPVRKRVEPLAVQAVDLVAQRRHGSRLRPRSPFSQIGVATEPGSMIATLTPKGCISWRSESPIASIAYLDAPYGPSMPMAFLPPDRGHEGHPPLCGAQSREQRLGDRNLSDDVDLELAPPLVDGDSLDRARDRDAGVVDEAGQASLVVRVDLLAKRLDRCGVGHIDDHRLDPCGVGLQRLSIGFLSHARQDAEPRAIERDGARAPDAGRAARDNDSAFAGQETAAR